MPRDERSKADYQPWNHEHFMADRFVRRMRPAARKTYVMLLHEAFFCSTRPYLPDDDNELWLLADCEDMTEWQCIRDEVLDMFERIEIDGQKVLAQRRVEEDWERLLEKRDVKTERSRKGGLARQAKLRSSKPGSAQADLSKPDSACLSQVSEVSKEREAELSEEPTENPENGQGEEMKAKKQLPVLCYQLLGVRAENYADVLNQIEARAIVTSNGQVVREFEEWAADNQHEEFRGKPLTAFLRSLETEKVLGAGAGPENPVVKAAGREIAYRTGNQVALNPKSKAILTTVVEEDDYTVQEIVEPFMEFFNSLEAAKIPYAGINFAQEASDRLYAARRKKVEKDTELGAIEVAKAKMQREAEEDRIRRAKEAELEAELMEEELPD